MFLRHSHPFLSQQWPDILSSTPRKRFEKTFREPDHIPGKPLGSLTSTGGPIHEDFMGQPRTELTSRNIACTGPSACLLLSPHRAHPISFWDIKGDFCPRPLLVILLHEDHNQGTPRIGERGPIYGWLFIPKQPFLDPVNLNFTYAFLPSIHWYPFEKPRRHP